MDQKSVFYVYVLFRPWDGRPFYVGKGKGKRWLDHERAGENHYNPLMSRIFTKARRLNLEVPKVKIRDNITEAEAYEIEIAFIAAIGRNQNGGPLANNTDGGVAIAGYLKHSEKTLEKMRKARIDRKLSDEHKANVSKSLIGNTRSVGRVHPQSTKSKMSEKQKAKWEEPGYRDRMKAIRKISNNDPDYRAKKSEQLKALWADPELRAMMTAAQTGRRRRRRRKRQPMPD